MITGNGGRQNLFSRPVKRISGEHVAATKTENMMQEAIFEFSFIICGYIKLEKDGQQGNHLGTLDQLFNTARFSKDRLSMVSTNFDGIADFSSRTSSSWRTPSRPSGYPCRTLSRPAAAFLSPAQRSQARGPGSRGRWQRSCRS